MTISPSLKPAAWKLLEHHAQEILGRQSSALPQNFQRQPLSACRIHLDYSKQRINHETLPLLFKLAAQSNLSDNIRHLMQGHPVNRTEGRPALHTALRAPDDARILVNGENIMTSVTEARLKMQRISEQIRNQLWLGYTGMPITDLVNIGLGGSDLGPRFCVQALAQFASDRLRYHFISDACPHGFEQTVKTLRPETTLFIISSKSFTTPETLYNARKAFDWIGRQPNAQQHFIAVSANVEKAHQFGIQTVLPIWQWVGGRYSFCSAINLISAIAIGYERFAQLLSGAYDMDRHFLQEDMPSNLPILLALLGIWNNNFLDIHHLLLLTYGTPLNQFVAYIQQLDMESNGKSIDNHGQPVHFATGPIIWGGPGNQAQHSYYQSLCQGTHQVTADFITCRSNDGQMLNQFARAKMHILTEGVNAASHPYALIPGNTPLNHLEIEDCTPYTIGALIALYEHKIFTQSVIWNINPFDQPGVESAKQRLTELKGTINA